MKNKLMISAVMWVLTGGVQASNEEEKRPVHQCQCSHRLALKIPVPSEEIQETSRGAQEKYMTYEELCTSFKSVSHPEVYALFEEGFGVLFGHLERRIPAERENRHITCLREKFTLSLEGELEPMASVFVKQAQKQDLATVFKKKGHIELFSEDFLQKLQ